MDSKILDLINADIDGELDSAGRMELEAVLAESEEAREARSDLLRVANVLESAPRLNTPEGFTEKVTRKVNLPRARGDGWWTKLFGSVQPLPVALSFAAGLLLAGGMIGVPAGGQGDAQNMTQMVGTMVASDRMPLVTEHGRMTLNSGGLTGTISLHESEDLYVLNFDLQSEQPVEVAVGLTQAGLAFSGIARSTMAENGSLEDVFQVSGGTLRVVNQGQQSMTVFLQPLADTEVQGNNLQIDILPGPSLGEPDGLQG